MPRHWLNLFSLMLAFAHVASAEPSASEQKRVQELHRFIKEEKKNIRAQEDKKHALLDEVERTNLALNHLRNEVSNIQARKQELSASVENLKAEADKEQANLQQKKGALRTMLRLLYRVHRDGLMEFVFGERNIANAVSRMRMVYHALKQSERSVEQMESYSKHLSESQLRLSGSSAELEKLLQKSFEQEKDLKALLTQKKSLLAEIQKRQVAFRRAEAEHKELSQRIAKIFAQIRKKAPQSPEVATVGELALPLEYGKIRKGFGKGKWGAEFHKGVEIEATHGSPVRAVEDGVVEFDGWVRGLGNVVIVHHGQGLYSLSGYLHQVSAPKFTKVQKGEVIGLVGDTGNHEQPALYFELRRENKVVDPTSYFSRSAWAQLS